MVMHICKCLLFFCYRVKHDLTKPSWIWTFSHKSYVYNIYLLSCASKIIKRELLSFFTVFVNDEAYGLNNRKSFRICSHPTSLIGMWFRNNVKRNGVSTQQCFERRYFKYYFLLDKILHTFELALKALNAYISIVSFFW